MATAKLFKADGSEGAPIALNDKVFDVEPNVGLLHQVATALLANKRQGNHETKVRKEVRGGGRKPFRQKGTGNARQGSRVEPQMRGGGTVFGPHRRSYRQKLPVKMSRKALCCALTDRVRNDALSVIDGMTVDTPKTKSVVELLSAIAPEGRKMLLVTATPDRNLVASANNMPEVSVRTALDVNALDVLDARRVIVQEDALAILEERLT